MKKMKLVLQFLALTAALYLFDRATDWWIPIWRQSPFFHGLMVFAGVTTLPFWVLLTASPDQRPFPPDARYPRPLVRLFLYSLSIGIAVYGLSFWFPMLETPSYVIMGTAAAAGVVFGYLLLRADKKQSAKVS